MGFRMNNYGGSLKNPVFRGRFTKNQYRFKVWLGEKEGGSMFLMWGGGWYPNAHYETWLIVAKNTNQGPKAPHVYIPISLSKIALQMWRDHSFSQRNKTTEWAVGIGLFWESYQSYMLNLYTPTPQNGQTNSNNLSAKSWRIAWVCLTIVWGWRLKG